MRPVAVIDLEVYQNFFLMACMDIESERVIHFEHPLDFRKIWAVFKHYRLVTFNGNRYDMPLIRYALAGASVAQLKAASNEIINRDLQPWVFAEQYGISLEYQTPNGLIEHVDIMGVAPGKAGLKTFGGRLHSRVVRELPYPHDAILTEEQIPHVREYCHNDLLLTRDLYQALRVELELREQMSVQYGLDLRSKSDAQIAEAVMKSELQKQLLITIKPPPKKRAHEESVFFGYRAPAWMPKTDLVHLVEAERFSVSHSGKVMLPKNLSSRNIMFGGKVYRMGIGGLHSTETSLTYRSNTETVLLDRDVASYYPAILLNLNLYPRHLGMSFVRVYRSLVERRLAAKKAGQRTLSECLKVCVNGLFGKMGSPYSPFYSPEMMISITLTGQLSLLMLIEQLAGYEGMTVVSANTDGITVEVARAQRERFNQVLLDWERTTGFVTEETEYHSIHIRDVNNYIAIKADGHHVKTKGAYLNEFSLKKNPSSRICSLSIIRYLTLDIPIESTVRACQDMREFVTVRKVNGGALYRGAYVGSVLRWYYSTDLVGDAFHYKVNGNKVPLSEGGKSLLTLPPPGSVPPDLDRDWYVATAYSMLRDLGEPV